MRWVSARRRIGPANGLTVQTGLFCLVAAFFLLFYGLGDRSLAGSEDRWAEIARNMLMRKDWFHPVINGEIYFDKPLVSYWFIVLAAYCTQALNEFSVRLPGAIAGLLTLYCSYQIAAAWFDRRIAWLSVCLIITSYGFLFWTHTASAELSNLALITAALAWFVPRRERTDFKAYAVFYLLCAVGCQLKGLTAFVVPILAIAPFVLRDDRWKSHLNLAHLAALVLATSVFLLPYLCASMLASPVGIETQHISGLDLLIRENIVRFFEPFDHVDPFYSYVYEIPRIVFPWSLFLVAGLAYYLPRYRALDQSRRWLLEAISLIFFFFTLSGSRRWYYVLPIMPFCMILIANYLGEPREPRWTRPAALATLLLLGAAAVLLIAIPGATHLYLTSVSVPIEFWIAAGLILVGGSAILWLGLGLGHAAALRQTTGLDAALSRQFLPVLLLLSALEMTAIFGFILPGADRYGQRKPFALALAKQLKSDETLVFYEQPNTTLVFYLDPRYPVPVIHNRSELSKCGNKPILVAQDIHKKNLFKDFPELANATPMLATQGIAKQLSSEKEYLVAYRMF